MNREKEPSGIGVSENGIEDKSNAKHVNRGLKDSVFTHLFKEKANLRKLYASFYDDEVKYKDSDFKILTLEPVLTNTVYNDLGFMVGDKLIVLVEEQSSYNPNMPIRMLIYAAYTYQEYIRERKLNLYGSKRIEIPRADFIVIHTFDGTIEQGKDMRLSDSYIDIKNADEVSLELKVSVVGKEISRDTIVYQYIRFCQIYMTESKDARSNREKLAAVRKTIKYCKEHDILKEYLEKKEGQVSEMLMSLFTQEEITDMILYEKYQEGMEKGAREGSLNTAKKMLAKGMSIEEIQEITDLSIADIKALKA